MLSLGWARTLLKLKTELIVASIPAGIDSKVTVPKCDRPQDHTVDENPIHLAVFDIRASHIIISRTMNQQHSI